MPRSYYQTGSWILKKYHSNNKNIQHILFGFSSSYLLNFLNNAPGSVFAFFKIMCQIAAKNFFKAFKNGYHDLPLKQFHKLQF